MQFILNKQAAVFKHLHGEYEKGIHMNEVCEIYEWNNNL